MAAPVGRPGFLCVRDYALAASETKSGLTETGLGLIPATISPCVLTRLGEGMARRIFISARIFDAGEAKAIGMVAEVVKPAGLRAVRERQIRRCLSAAPGAASAALALAPDIGEQRVNTSIARRADASESPEAAGGIWGIWGIGAFFKRRAANRVKRPSVAGD